MISKNAAIRAINADIKWHKENTEKLLTKKEAEMFFRGMEQAKIIIRQLQNGE